MVKFPVLGRLAPIGVELIVPLTKAIEFAVPLVIFGALISGAVSVLLVSVSVPVLVTYALIAETSCFKATNESTYLLVPNTRNLADPVPPIIKPAGVMYN
ncbi:hypothetical protein D3C87_964260 [compost metagenome]